MSFGIAPRLRTCGALIVASSSFVEVIEFLMERCTKEEFDLHAKEARRIWFRRNTLVHGGDFVLPNEVINSTSKFIGAYRAAMEKERDAGVPVEILQGTSGVVRWKPPPPGTLKTNWDSALDLTSRKMGMGFIVWDSNGRVYAAGCSSLDTCMEPVLAEAEVSQMSGWKVTRYRWFSLSHILGLIGVDMGKLWKTLERSCNFF